MTSEIRTISYPNGDIQRVQLVRWEDWNALEFLPVSHSDGALSCFAEIYRKFLVPACPCLFGNMVLFRLPKDVKMPFPFDTQRFGRVSHRLTAAAAALEKGVQFRGGKPVFRDKMTEAFYRELEGRNCLTVVRGKLPVTTIIPVGDLSGLLSETEQDAACKVNASFFIMDRFDCATVFDHLGIPLGLCVKDGVVENPPLYHREALLVRENGEVSVTVPRLRDMTLEIGGKEFRHGKNAMIYTRPDRMKTPRRKGKKLVIVGNRVEAVSAAERILIPASGFVLCPEGPCEIQPGQRVVYHGMEDVRFGIQVGNSIVRNGVKTEKFLSRFYNIRALQPVPYPPSLYPLNFKGGRAARIALGADRDGKPMLLWAEGAAKLGYVPGKDSRGASLADMARICSEAGMWNAVNLDGGGSAQILLQNTRSLKISDRRELNYDETERPVPLGLIIR